MTSRRDATDRQPQSDTPVQKAGGATSSIDPAAYNSMFVSMVMNMSWQLAIVVIVPIFGGYMLDQRLHSSPVLVLLGLVIAVIATCGVLWRTVQLANSRVAALQPKDEKK